MGARRGVGGSEKKRRLRSVTSSLHWRASTGCGRLGSVHKPPLRADHDAPDRRYTHGLVIYYIILSYFPHPQTLLYPTFEKEGISSDTFLKFKYDKTTLNRGRRWSSGMTWAFQAHSPGSNPGRRIIGRRAFVLPRSLPSHSLFLSTFYFCP